MMAEKYYILVAEGITDCSFLEAVLERYLGYKQYQNARELPPLFFEMIGQYPASSGKLQRQDSPMFFNKDHVSVAVKQAGGCSNIPAKVSLLVELIDKLEVYDKFGGFLVFSDTDLSTKHEIISDFRKKFLENDIILEDESIKVYGRQIACGLYLFPMSGCGAVEKLLLECAEISYGQLYLAARKFREEIMQQEYQELRKECWTKNEAIQEFYADKVQFGAVSAVLKPDKPVRFAIKDKLIKAEYFDLFTKLPEFKNLYDFLHSNLV